MWTPTWWNKSCDEGRARLAPSRLCRRTRSLFRLGGGLALPTRSKNMPEELFDIVDDQDRVIGQMARFEVHRRKLFHRAVSIFVFDSRGRLLLQ